MAQHHAHYQVLHDYRFKLKRDEEKTLRFRGVSHLTGDKAILAYKVKTNGKPMKYEVDVNDTRQVYNEPAVSHGFPLGTWEAVSSRELGKNGTVQFRVESGDGWVEFSDVVLWVNRN